VVRVALVLALAAVIAAGLPSPGLFVALGCGIGAIGTGAVAYGRRSSPGAARLAAAGAITLGGIGLALGAVRVAMVIAAIGRIDSWIG
jgi:hypothetical protein